MTNIIIKVVWVDTCLDVVMEAVHHQNVIKWYMCFYVFANVVSACKFLGVLF